MKPPVCSMFLFCHCLLQLCNYMVNDRPCFLLYPTVALLFGQRSYLFCYFRPQLRCYMVNLRPCFVTASYSFSTIWSTTVLVLLLLPIASLLYGQRSSLFWYCFLHLRYYTVKNRPCFVTASYIFANIWSTIVYVLLMLPTASLLYIVNDRTCFVTASNSFATIWSTIVLV